MLGYFPQPYKDELLYSICARYSEIVKFPNNRLMKLELFGSATTEGIVDLPNNIQYLSNALPSNKTYSVDQIIDNHTLFTYYRSFLEPEKANYIKSRMIESGSIGLHHSAGLAASRVSASKFLSFCPLCAKEDYILYGETYWHRQHQLPAVIVCDLHNVYLEISSVKRSDAESYRDFCPASSIISDNITPRFIGNSQQEILILRLAQLSRELITQNFPSVGKKVLRNKYFKLLIEKDFATYTLSLKATELESRFIEFYPAELLTELGCELPKFGNSAKGNWLLNLLRGHETGAHHPVQHLLILIFLDTNITDFFTLPDELTFFGESPWQCLNPASAHYREPVITEFKLGKRCRNGKPVGIFKCKCGFEFARSGPDTNGEDRFRIDKIINFGDVWEKELIKLWNNPAFNLSEISRFLKVDTLTIRRYANKLNLSFERGAKSYKNLSQKDVLKDSSDIIEKSKEDKTAWISMKKCFPSASLKELRQINSNLYQRLHSNNYDWLKCNFPPKIETPKSTKSVNWNKRDDLISEKIHLTVNRLLETSNHPIRITKTKIGKEIDCLSFLIKKIGNLPKTQALLNTLVETNDDYALRRIKWAANKIREDRTHLSYWKVVEKAGVSKQRNKAVIREAVMKELPK